MISAPPPVDVIVTGAGLAALAAAETGAIVALLEKTPRAGSLPAQAALLCTDCGLRVDTTMRVLDVRGQPIDRLYAAYAAGYMSGSSLGKATIFGHIAGNVAASA